MQKPPLQFYNTLSRKKERFKPLNSKNVRVYVCGPTVYSRIHIGNARPIVVFDVLVRLLRYHYPKVTYVRNITDVDDKINTRAHEAGIGIDALTQDTIKQFHADCEKLGARAPDAEPRATEHIEEMLAMIEALLAKNHAYEAEGHILFDVASYPDYGRLSGRSIDEMKAGARVEIAPYKKSPMDFVLWKPSDANTPGWDSPWGRGRPGWHIECSAMSRKHLGTEFDIHGGGVDLVFPHHENEICQSHATHGKHMARFWLHNGYVMMGGAKMAKSEGNFVDMATLLETRKGEVIRLALLQTHYRKPLDFSYAILDEAETVLDKFYRAVEDVEASDEGEVDKEFLKELGDDLNTPNALKKLHKLADEIKRGNLEKRHILKRSANMIGLLENTESQWLHIQPFPAFSRDTKEKMIDDLIEIREILRKSKNFDVMDRIRDMLEKHWNITIKDTSKGTTWRKKNRRKSLGKSYD